MIKNLIYKYRDVLHVSAIRSSWFVEEFICASFDFTDDCQHFGWGDYEWLLGEVLDVACYEKGVFLAQGDFVENQVFGIW